MSIKAKLLSSLLSASFVLLGLPIQENFKAYSQSGSSLDTYTKNRLDGYQYQNSSKRFKTSQITQQVYRNSVPSYSQYSNASIRNRIFSSSGSSRPKSKPFSSITRGPAVTPYLGLTGLPSGGAPNYYTNVKPRLEQQRVNERAQRQNAAFQHQLNQVAAQGPFNIKGTESMAPTGHAAVYMNYGGYYPEGR